MTDRQEDRDRLEDSPTGGSVQDDLVADWAQRPGPAEPITPGGPEAREDVAARGAVAYVSASAGQAYRPDPADYIRSVLANARTQAVRPARNSVMDVPAGPSSASLQAQLRLAQQVAEEQTRVAIQQEQETGARLAAGAWGERISPPRHDRPQHSGGHRRRVS